MHFILPFLVSGVLVVHLALLHYQGSGAAASVPSTTVDGEAFMMYYYKDGIPLPLLLTWIDPAPPVGWYLLGERLTPNVYMMQGFVESVGSVQCVTMQCIYAYSIGILGPAYTTWCTYITGVLCCSTGEMG